MINKLKASLAYRLPALYKLLLQYRSVTIAKGKSYNDTQVVMMTGNNHLLMTKLAVASIADNWSVLPKLIISTDGSLSTEVIRKNLAFWPGELHVLDWKDTVSFHKAHDRKALLTYAETQPFGKKMALILRFAANAPVLWLDSDILFFNDFAPYLPQNVQSFFCGGSEDFQRAYHQAVLDIYHTTLPDHYCFNAGILYASGGDIYERFNLEETLNRIHPAYDFLTEQTIFACIAQASLGVLWPKTIIKSFHEDNQRVKPMNINNTVARHYTSNVRHLFWRDAFYHL
ncbi:hypothetical protein GCM10027037_24090 [Mucilaginibacter koreensis]